MHHEQLVSCNKSKEDEQATSEEIDRAMGDLTSNQISGKNGSSGADRVANNAAERDTVRVLGGGEGDGGDLRAVAPFRNEGESEGLDQDGARRRRENVSGAR